MFATFPQFTQLRLDHRDLYERYVAAYPPISDLSFSTLMIWWNLGRDLAVSTLNGNLIISYHLPGDERSSGLCLIGRDRVDETLDQIFREQRRQGHVPRLVHVPECVVECIAEKECVAVAEEVEYHEYIVPVARLYPLETARHTRRGKIKRYLKAVSESCISTRVLDLAEEANQEALFRAACAWWAERGVADDMGGYEGQALSTSLRHAGDLGLQNICLYVGHQLEGFALFHEVKGKRTIIASHMHVRYGRKNVYDYMTYVLAAECDKRGIVDMNFEMDLGIPGLREHKRQLAPSGFFRKYTVTPALSLVAPARGGPWSDGHALGSASL